MKRNPLVLGSNAEIQQLQANDNLRAPGLQAQIDNLKILLAKLISNQIRIGLPIEDPDLINFLNEIKS